MYDIIVIGAGLSGLYSAYLLQNSGKKVLILEARSRVGGRTFTENGIDLGGQWVGSSQKRVIKLLEKFNLQIYPQYQEGKSISHLDQDITYYSSNISESDSNDNLQNTIKQLDTLSQILKKDDDEISAMTWLNTHCQHPNVRNTIDWLFKVCTCVESSEVSFYFWLLFLKKCGGYAQIANIKDGAQEYRIRGGSMQLSEHLVKSLEIEYESPVIQITQNESECQVLTKSKTYKCKYIINTVPRSLNKNIEYIPTLHPAKELSFSSSKMGSVIKIIIEFSSPFWRERGYSGEIITNKNLMFLSYDASTDKKWAIVCFICGNEVLKYRQLSILERKHVILSQYFKYFKDERVFLPINWFEKDWGLDEWSGGCYFEVPKIGFASRLEEEYKRPSGRIHWAGTETADEWMGYMEGALQSAERATREILEKRQLSKL